MELLPIKIQVYHSRCLKVLRLQGLPVNMVHNFIHFNIKTYDFG